jgi:eukaryotic-like serine/threonine-protein kinase
LGAYEVLSPFGVGGMSEVYRARDTERQRELALKVLPAGLTRDSAYMARCKREVRTLASLNHPSVAAVYGTEQNAIVMELVPGATLEDRIASGGLPLDEAVDIARQMAEALEAAHAKGIVHRNFKPANVKITPDGVVKILDFQAGMNVGMPAYMSPEQAAGHPVDKHANVWSFGVMLYEMVTGTRLFGGGTVARTLAGVQQGPVDFARLPDGTPSAIRALLGRCLDRDVRSRLRTIGEARAAIGNYLANPSAAPPAAKLPAARSAKTAWTSAAAAAIVALVLAFLALRPNIGASPAERILVPPVKDKTPFQDDAFAGSGVAVSPDGRSVVFQTMSGGASALWLRELDQPGARMLAGTANAAGPFWSPDSRNVGFSASGKLKRIAVSGGPPIPICNVGYSTGASWSRDDVIIFGTNDGGIFRVAAGGGAAVPVTALDKSRGEDSHRYPWFLPDGRHFLYTARLGERRNSSVYIGDLESAERKPVIDVASNAVYADPGYVLFAVGRTLMAQPFDAGRLRTTGVAVPVAPNVSYSSNAVAATFGASRDPTLAYTSSDVGRVQLTWFDRSGKVLGTVGAPGEMEFLSLAPDASAVVVARNNPATWKFDLWQYGLARRGDSRFTFTGHDRFPVWSADGKNVAFNGSQGGVTKLYQKAANGTGEEEVLEAADRIPADWSWDGRYLITMTGNQTPITGNDIWVHPLFGSRRPFPYLNSKANEFFARLSPDGKWMAYTSNETGRDEVYVVAFPVPGSKWQVSTGGSRPVWSRDGREIYYMSVDGKIMAAKTRPGATLQTDTPKPLFAARFPFKNHNFDVTGDGRFLIPVLVDQSSVPLTVIRNWPALLKNH